MPTTVPGLSHKSLYQQAGFSDVTRLERWDAGLDLGTRSYPQGAEFFVLEGQFADEAGAYPQGFWLRLPAGFHASVVAEGLGAIRHLAVRENGDVYVSTPQDKEGKGGGIIALHLDAAHKAEKGEAAEEEE